MYSYERKKFHPQNSILNIDELLDLTSKFIIKKEVIDKFEVLDISSKDRLRLNSVLFLKKRTKIPSNSFKNIFIITDDNLIFENNNFKNKLLVNHLDSVYSLIANKLFIHDDNILYKDEFDLKNNSLISKYSSIDSSTKVHPNCIIGRGVEIGKNCIIKNNVVIKNAIILENVTICENTTIGSTGFGFNINNLGSSNLIPQLGIVHIGKNVHIGANCTVDRAKIDLTIIGDNSMIDNLVHVAHNVEIGKNACIAAQCGISGSVKIGNNFISGGQSGYAGHITIGNNVIVAAKSGVTKNLKHNSKVAGFPAINIYDWKKNIIKMRK